MTKSTPNYLLSVVVIAGLLGIISLGAFYIARNNVNTVTVPSGSLSPDDSNSLDDSDDSKEDVADLALRIVSLIPKDAIPAILEPRFISAQSAEDEINDTEKIIGVSINGEARAYPIDILSRHEIVNDVVGGESIAVTW